MAQKSGLLDRLIGGGALNWGLVGVFDWNLVAKIFGSVSWLERLIYILVGVSGLYMIYSASGSKSEEQ